MNEDTSRALRVILGKLFDSKLIADAYYASLLSQTWDSHTEADQFGADLATAIKRVDFYKLLERIERGEKMIASEIDPAKRAGQIKFLHRLIGQLIEVEGAT